MIKRCTFIRRLESLSHEEFRRHWLGIHVPLARGIPSLRGYVVNITDVERSTGATWDGFSELWFDSPADMDAAFGGPHKALLDEDLRNFVAALEVVVVEEHRII
jgi:uncharacterized protein (TIGR02118 family)